MNSCIRLSCCVNRVISGNPQFCCESVTDLLEESAQQSADICLFPRLALCPPSSDALLQNPAVCAQCEDALDQVRVASAKNESCIIIGLVKRFGGKPVVLNLPPIDSGRYFRWISRNLSPSRILRFLKEVGFIGRWQEMFNIAAVQVASAAGVPVIDIRSAFLAQPDFRSYLCADGIHPNEAGQKLIYGAIRRQLPSAT